jgi:transcriptional regulator with XRE-family HTH domain
MKARIKQPTSSASDETACSAVFRAGLVVARRNAKMTQAELAKATGLQPAAISHFECGQRQPSLANLRKLCLALKTSADFLLCLPNSIRSPNGISRYREVPTMISVCGLAGNFLRVNRLSRFR